MVPYYILVLAPFVLAFGRSLYCAYNGRTDTKKNSPITIFFIIYFLLLALRSVKVGADTGSYQLMFDQISRVSWAGLYEYKSTELGYTLLNKLISVFTDNPQFLICIVAAITTFPLTWLYYKESENPLMTIALFLVFPVYIMNFSGLRQAIAIALGVPTYYAAKNGRPIWFVLSVLLAVGFHHSALILFVLYPVYHANIRLKHLILLIPGFVFAFLNSTRIYTVFIPLLGEKYVERYSEIIQTGAYTMIILLIMFIAYSFIVPDESLVDDETRGLRNILIFALFIQLFSTISAYTMRLNYYFLIFVPLLIPKITNRWVNMDDRIKVMIKAGITGFFVLYYLDKAHSVDSLQIYPYIPFWQ